jgi:hydroxymethylpyrimidine/phosphomethylpyrimidine kinase
VKVVLCVAGTDPSSAAGLTSDVQVVRDYGMHPAVVVTAVVAQNTGGVRALHRVPVEIIAAQLDAAWDDFDIRAVKVGLVADDATATLVGGRLGALSVWDPVLRSGDGATALCEADTDVLRSAMLHSTVVTPNVLEASALTGTSIETRAQAKEAASTLAACGIAVLLKTGHLPPQPQMRDIWATASTTAIDLEPLATLPGDVRGTGCHLATALACELATGAAPLDAAEGARRYLHERLRCDASALGRGRRLIVHGS